MIPMIKKNWSLLLLLLVIGIVSVNFIKKKNSSNRIKLHVKTFNINNGWGYDVLTNDTVYIHQEYIPAIEGNKMFVEEGQAKTIGSLVIKKLKARQSPTISIKELDSCSISYR